MINKLRKKLVAVSMLSLLAVLTVIVAGINIINYNNVISNSDTILQMLAENGGKFPEPINNQPRPEEKSVRENNLRTSRELPFETRYFFVLMSENGQVLSCDVDKIAAINEDTAKEYAYKVWQGNKHRGFVGNYRYLKFYEGENIRVIFIDSTRALDNFQFFMLASCSVSIAGFVAVFFLIVIFSGRIIKPVSQSYEKQKQFITDAGHEIKTPITIIDADAEVLEMEIGENEWLKDIRSQAKRLAGLTSDLIYLAKMEESRESLEMIDFPISDIASEAVQSFMSLAKTQNKSFEVNIEEMVSYKGDEKAIIQLINILLDNALKHSNDGGTIRLSLNKQGKAVTIKVSNSADNVNMEELDLMFDRFYRADKSRNSKTGGHGIGLSIAQAIVNAHKGKVSASLEKENILVITVNLPV